MSKFEKALEKLNIYLNEKQLSQFQTYYEMLIETNKVMNLTAITEYDEVVDKHFVDSLSLIQAVDLNQSLKVIDVGTGAGFPGIPLKIAFPELKIVLLDSLNKRINFLNRVIEALELTDIETIMEELKILEGIQSTGNSLICVYPGLWPTYPHYRNIVCLLFRLEVILFPINQEKYRKRWKFHREL